MTEAGFFWCKKVEDSAIWTGVPTKRIYILFADSYLGGQQAVDYYSSTWDRIIDNVSNEEAVVNHAVLIAIAANNYDEFVRQTKDLF